MKTSIKTSLFYLVVVALLSATQLQAQSNTFPSSGNVGIGTTSPSARLAVEGGNLHIGNKTNANGQRRYARIYGHDAGEQFYGTIHSNW